MVTKNVKNQFGQNLTDADVDRIVSVRKCDNCNKSEPKYKCTHCGCVFCVPCSKELEFECSFCTPLLVRIDDKRFR